jgi:hypothetical protein
LTAAQLVSTKLLQELGAKPVAAPAEPQPVADLMPLPPPIE